MKRKHLVAIGVSIAILFVIILALGGRRYERLADR